MQRFIAQNSDWVEHLMRSNHIPREVKGVSFAFVHVYHKPGDPLHGKLCVVCGRECGGKYAGQYNFFGGKVEESDGYTPVTRVLSASFRELWEEMGVEFTVPLHKVVVDVIVKGQSLLWVCAVNGISCTKLNELIESKRKMHLPYAYMEMTKCKHITEGDLDRCSSYVQEQFRNVARVYRNLPLKPLHFQKSMRVVCGKWV